jgi:hypothetical protein
MRPEKLEKVLEKLATGDKAAIVIKRQTDRKSALRQGAPPYCSEASHIR